MYKLRLVPLFLSLVLVLSTTNPVMAQDSPVGPTYTIQPGDTLNLIASKFSVSVDELIAVNGIENPNILSAGQQIVIPGLEGVSGNLTAETIPLGATLTSLSVQHQFPLSMLIKLNKVTSPEEVYAGSSLILPISDQAGLMNAQVLKPAESLLETASKINSNPWLIALQNNLDQTWQATPSRPLFYASNAPDATQAINPIPLLKNLQFDEMPIIQGHTVEITAAGDPGLVIAGKLNGKTLHFFSSQDGLYYSLQGLHALTPPGLIDFELSISKPDSTSFSFSQRVLLQSGFYPEDPPLTVDPTTVDPENIKNDNEIVNRIMSVVSPEQLWTGKFREPVDEPVCYKSGFGVRRIYNGQPTGIHGGLDYGVCANLNIYAPAAGTVVFAGPLTALGNATFIDHGRGVFTGYGHQNEIKVNVGDHVEPGQLIGIIGATGRVTGPHLHWEIWVNGTQVSPTQWLQKTYP